jgi:hypothetical protein
MDRWLLLLRLLNLIGYRLGEVVPGLLLLAGTTAHLNVTNVSDFSIVMYHYFIHFQLVKASAHTILVPTTAVTPVTTMTVGEDAAEDAMMTTGVVVGTTTAGDTVAVIMIVEKGVDMAATVVATTIVADVIMIDGTECRLTNGMESRYRTARLALPFILAAIFYILFSLYVLAEGLSLG